MLAKSFPPLFQSGQVGKPGPRARRMVSVLVLVAALAALVLILEGQYWKYVPDNVDSRTASFENSESNQGTPRSPGVSSVSAAAKENRHHLLAEFLARRYSVSREVTNDLVQMAYSAGHRLGLDPLLIIAVMAIESGLNPIAESVSGAKGLMQVIPKYHPEKFEEFGGEKAVFDPRVNILIGSRILKEYLARTGNLRVALQMYAGALDDNQDLYTTRVMNEKLRLQRILGQISPHATRTNATPRIEEGAPLHSSAS